MTRTQRIPSLFKRTAQVTGALVGLGAVALALFVWNGQRTTERDIAAHHQRVVNAPPALQAASTQTLATLPAPVHRYLATTFGDALTQPGGIQPVVMHNDMEGQFRRPLTNDFNFTTASQTANSATPALMFDANTPMLGVLWARAYDAYVNGKMEMKAKVVSTVEVVHEDEFTSPELNLISLRRWLLESPTYPHALLPGGQVTWEAIDNNSARAVAHLGDQHIGVIARFSPEGDLISMEAEKDGDLTTPYHGSGEHVARSDWQDVQGVRVPMGFRISRMAGGKIYPFWEGRITQLKFSPLSDTLAGASVAH
ncbi:DUF6544 family protein [Hydrogenophaga sp. 5NK40-0174]|uniref:DUF6920 family protein n=1 Tax=Hydrogenophaga sp. 5NK40-0174 TaxID=3127649 RepID=UPI0031095A23